MSDDGELRRSIEAAFGALPLDRAETAILATCLTRATLQILARLNPTDRRHLLNKILDRAR